MSRIIGDRKEKSVLEEMAEVARERNKEVAEEIKREELEAERREAERKTKKDSKGTTLIEAPSEEAKAFLEKVNGMETDGGYLYYDGTEHSSRIVKTSVRSTASVALANFFAGNKSKAAEINQHIIWELGSDYGMIDRTDHLFRNSWEAYTADNAYMAIYCFLSGDAKGGKVILDEIEKRIPKQNTPYYGISEKNELFYLSNQALMFAARTYAGQDLEEEYIILKQMRLQDGMYKEFVTCNHTTKATASMAFLSCLYNEKKHAREILELLKKSCKTYSGLYRADYNNETIYTEDNALVAIASLLSA